MIDKKKLKDVMKKQDLKQEKPTDPSMTLDVKRRCGSTDRSISERKNR